METKGVTRNGAATMGGGVSCWSFIRIAFVDSEVVVHSLYIPMGDPRITAGSVFQITIGAILIVCLVPPVIFMVVGLQAKDDDCIVSYDGQPNFSHFLVLLGIVNILYWICNIAALIGFWKGEYFDPTQPSRYQWTQNGRFLQLGSGIVACMHIVFELVWAIRGSVMLSKDQHCQQSSPGLYNSVLAAVIIEYIYSLTSIEIVAKGMGEAIWFITNGDRREEYDSLNEAPPLYATSRLRNDDSQMTP